MSSACSLGSILLQPQRVDQFAAPAADDALFDDLLSVIALVSADHGAGGTMLDDVLAALEDLGPKLQARAGSGLDAAVGRVREAIRPLVGMLDRVVALFDDDDPAVIADRLVTLLETLGDITDVISIESIRAHATLFVSLLEEDLGLTQAALEEEFWSLTDDLIARLEIVPPGLDPSLAANRRAVGGTLRRLRRSGHGAVRFPTFDADKIAQLLFDELDKLVGPHLKQVACLGHITTDTRAALAALVGAVPFTGFATGTLGAAEPRLDAAGGEYLWYASWLLGKANLPASPMIPVPFPSQVWVDDGDASRRIMFDETPLLLKDDPRGLPCQHAPASWIGLMSSDLDERSYTFHKVDPGVMEQVAFHSAWAVDVAESLLHLASPWKGVTIRKGGRVSLTDSFDLGVALSRGAVKAFAGRPTSFAVSPGQGGQWVNLLPTVGSHLLGSLQVAHTKAHAEKAMKMWGALVVPDDALRLNRAYRPASMARDGLLSCLTLLNLDPSSKAPDGLGRGADNRRHTEGLLRLLQLLADIIMIKGSVDPKYYGQPFSGDTAHLPDFKKTFWLNYMLVYGSVYGMVTGLAGSIVAWAMSGARAPDGEVWGLNIAWSVAKSVLGFPLNLFLWMDGTAGGTLNLEAGDPFPGYPEQAESPYLLPWAAGDTWVCGQGNLGLFSHNFPMGTPQVYAYDFMLDMGTEILASRPGTVVDYFDWVPDGTGDLTPAPPGPTPPAVPGGPAPVPAPNPDLVAGQTAEQYWNFIVIRHDLNDQPPANKSQDVGAGGLPTTTYAVYGHGLQNGVRDVFAKRVPPIVPTDIIGQIVDRGEPIMLADSTGISLCNHVHMEVRAGPPPPPAPAAGAPPAPSAPVLFSMLKITIPFVFKDGGQPSTLDWLLSTNERVPPLPAPAPT